MFAALRRDWELSQSREVPLPFLLPVPDRTLLILYPLEEKLRTRRIRALKRPVGVRPHESLSPTEPAFNLAISHKYLNHRQLTPSPWSTRHVPRGLIPCYPSLPPPFPSLGSRRFVAWGPGRPTSTTTSWAQNVPNPRQLATSPDSCTEPTLRGRQLSSAKALAGK